MENERVLTGVLIFLALVVGANLFMYGIVRGAIKGGGANWMNAIRKSFDKPSDGSSNQSMDELHRRVEELQKKKDGR
jgi:hypothetical protein